MIEIKGTSTEVVDKQEIANAFANLEKAENDTQKMKALSEISNILESDLEADVTIEVEEYDLIELITYANGSMDEGITQAVISSLSDDYIEEEYNDRNLAKPVLATDFNAYDFKRHMCDFFETGYHIDSFDLVKLLAEKLEIEYLL